MKSQDNTQKRYFSTNKNGGSKLYQINIRNKCPIRTRPLAFTGVIHNSFGRRLRALISYPALSNKTVMAVQWRHRRQGQTTATCHKMIIRCEQQHYTCCFMTRMSTSEMNENHFFSFFIYSRRRGNIYLSPGRGDGKTAMYLLRHLSLRRFLFLKQLMISGQSVI